MIALRSSSRLPAAFLLASLLFVTAAGWAHAQGNGEEAEARLGSALDAWHRGDPQTATAEIEAILSALESSTTAESHWRSAARFELGEIEWKLGRDLLAGAHFLQVLESEPTSRWSPRARLGLARSLIATGDWQAAAQSLQLLMEGESGADREAAADHLRLLERFELQPLSGRAGWSSCDLISTEATDPGKLVGIATTLDGAVLVAGRKAVVRIDSAGRIEDQVAWASSGAPFVDSLGATYAVGPTSALEIGGRQREFVDGGGRGQALSGLVAGGRDDWGRWMIASTRADGLLLYASGGEYMTTLREPSGVDPLAMTRDSRGRLLALDGRGRRVLRLNFDSLSPRVVLTGSWKRPQDLAVDSHDNLYILDRGERQVMVYNYRGDEVATLGPQLRGGCELKSPEGLAVDSSGRIYVADSRAKTIVVID